MSALPIADIKIGERDRDDLGDVAGLASSIEAVGLLHPVVVTEAHDLVAGDRRLAAAVSLGWTEIPVTIVDLATAEEHLRAEADENTCRKGLTPYEASRARERRARVLAPAAAERKDANLKRGKARGSKLDPREDTPKPVGKVRQVASTGTGYSPTTLDKVDTIRDAAEKGVIKTIQVIEGKPQRVDVPAPEPVVEVAKKALEDVKVTGAAIDRSSRDLDAAVEAYVAVDPDVKRARFLKKFAAAQRDLLNVTEFDAAEVAALLDAGELGDLEHTVATVERWLTKVREARPSRLRAIGGQG